MLRRTNVITVSKQMLQTDTTPPSCELVIEGRVVGQRLQGCVLEAAFQCNVGYLLFLTHDCPFEEKLSIYLINELGKIIDSENLFWMCSTGYFNNAQIQQIDEISFEFFDRVKDKEETIWTLKMLPKPTFRIPFFLEPPGVFRKFLFKRHFSLTASPRPGTC